MSRSASSDRLAPLKKRVSRGKRWVRKHRFDILKGVLFFWERQVWLFLLYTSRFSVIDVLLPPVPQGAGVYVWV